MGVIAFVSACKEFVALFNALFKLMESGPIWRRTLVALLSSALVVGALAGLWSLVAMRLPPAPVTQQQPPPKTPDPGSDVRRILVADDRTCSELNLAKYAPEYKECPAQAYVASKGSCTYPEGTIGASGATLEEDVRAYCDRLALRALATK